MTFESIKTEIEDLLNRLAEPEKIEDKHELRLLLLEKLNEFRATGMPLPEDLVALEEELRQEGA
jgi:hypothetical protein